MQHVAVLSVVWRLILTVHTTRQCCCFSRNTAQVTPIITYFYHKKNYLLGQSIQKIKKFNFEKDFNTTGMNATRCPSAGCLRFEPYSAHDHRRSIFTRHTEAFNETFICHRTRLMNTCGRKKTEVRLIAHGVEQWRFFSKLNNIFVGYFDPINIYFW